MSSTSDVLKEEAEKLIMGDYNTSSPITPYSSNNSNDTGNSSPLPSIDRSTFEDHPQDCNSYSSGDSDGEIEDDSVDDGEGPVLSLEELLYSINSYHAIIQPVSATMIFAALASVFINTDASRAFGEEQFASAYNVWQVDSSGDGNIGKNLLVSLGNTFVMVLVIGTMTFGIVLLYKYR